MAWRLFEFKCSRCDKQTEELVQMATDGTYDPPPCPECQGDLVRVFTPTTAQFSPSFFSFDRPRRIEIAVVDSDGKEHRKNVTHKIDINNAPGQFTTKDD